MDMTPRGRTGSQKSRAVSQVIDALIAGRGKRPEDVYLAAGLTKSTFYNRMKLGDWKFSEVADIAEFFDVPISVFFEGMGGLFTGEVFDNRNESVRNTDEFAQMAA